MAVFRIEKTRDYTVMANHHLRNTALSLKAKGLLSLMLSLPEDWDYTTKGPCPDMPGWSGQHLCYGSGAEDVGYIIRERVRTPTGGSAASSTRSWSSPGHRTRSLGKT